MKTCQCMINVELDTGWFKGIVFREPAGEGTKAYCLVNDIIDLGSGGGVSEVEFEALSPDILAAAKRQCVEQDEAARDRIDEERYGFAKL